MKWIPASEKKYFESDEEMLVASIGRLTNKSDLEWWIEHVIVTYVDEQSLEISPIEGGDWVGDWGDVQYYLPLPDLLKELPDPTGVNPQ